MLRQFTEQDMRVGKFRCKRVDDHSNIDSFALRLFFLGQHHATVAIL